MPLPISIALTRSCSWSSSRARRCWRALASCGRLPAWRVFDLERAQRAVPGASNSISSSRAAPRCGRPAGARDRACVAQSSGVSIWSLTLPPDRACIAATDVFKIETRNESMYSELRFVASTCSPRSATFDLRAREAPDENPNRCQIAGSWWRCSRCSCRALVRARRVRRQVAVTHAGKGQIVAVGAENEYANVISQIGGGYVAVTAIESNPNTDPHTFEASPSVARQSAPPSSSSRTVSATTPT